MNGTDVVIDAGINVSRVTGLDAVRREISAAAAAGIGDIFGAAVNTAAVKRKAAFDAMEALLPDLGKGTTKERLETERAIRRYLNIASRQDFSTEAHKEIALLEERINATLAVTRGRAKLEGLIPSTQILQEEAKAAKRAAAGISARGLRARVTRALNGMDAGQGIWGTDDKEAQLDELATIKYNLDSWAQQARRSNVGGRLTREQVLYQKHQTERIDAQTKELKGINKNTASSWDELKKIGGFIGAGGAGIALGNKLSGAVGGIYGSTEPFQRIRKLGADFAQYAGGSIGAIVGGLIGSILAPFTGGLSIAAGAAIGGGIGAYAGGNRNRTMQAAQRAQSDATQQMRYRALYRGTSGAAGWQTGKMMEAVTGGMVSAGSVEGMASAGQEFQANVAFGEVGEGQWLGLAMLPNYFNAMMSGATPEEQIRALQKDTEGMSPGLQQFAMRHAGVPDDIRALINSPVFNDVLGYGVDTAVAVARDVEQYQAGLISAQYKLGIKNRRGTVAQARKASRSGSVYDYDPTKGPRDTGNEFADVLGMLEYEDTSVKGGFRNGVRETVDALWGGANVGRPATIDGENLTKRELNIYVDNQHVATVGDVYTTEQVGDRVTYTAGGY